MSNRLDTLLLRHARGGPWEREKKEVRDAEENKFAGCHFSKGKTPGHRKPSLTSGRAWGAHWRAGWTMVAGRGSFNLESGTPLAVRHTFWPSLTS
jgi:hypothetical protein